MMIMIINLNLMKLNKFNKSINKDSKIIWSFLLNKIKINNNSSKIITIKVDLVINKEWLTQFNKEFLLKFGKCKIRYHVINNYNFLRVNYNHLVSNNFNSNHHNPNYRRAKVCNHLNLFSKINNNNMYHLNNHKQSRYSLLNLY